MEVSTIVVIVNAVPRRRGLAETKHPQMYTFEPIAKATVAPTTIAPAPTAAAVPALTTVPLLTRKCLHVLGLLDNY